MVPNSERVVVAEWERECADKRASGRGRRKLERGHREKAKSIGQSGNQGMGVEVARSEGMSADARI